jgi:DNA-binding GntR family transcriptional regulator
LFTIKEVLEGLAAGLLAERGNEKDIYKIQEAVTTMEDAIRDTNYKLYVEANNMFHEAILEGADNSKLSFMLNMLLNQIPYTRYVYLTIEVPNRLEKSLSEHQAIFNAIKIGDSVEAEKKMREHVRASGNQLKIAIAKKLYQGK